jgi:hypothetical protein
VEDRHRHRETVRLVENERRERLLSSATEKEDLDMQRVHEGKEPIHSVHMLHVTSLHSKSAGRRISTNVVDRPFFSSHGSSGDHSSSGLGRRRALATPEVPRLSRVILRKSRAGAGRDRPSHQTTGTNAITHEDSGII